MKRFATALGLLGLSVATPAFAQVQATPVWVRSAATGNLPAFVQNDNLSRGFAYEPTTNRLFVVSRTAVAAGRRALGIYIVNAATGADMDSLKVASAPGASLVTGGTFALNDAGATADGRVIACNLVTAASATAPFKCYGWANDQALPTVVLSEGSNVTGRLGDTFAVTGRCSDNTAALWVPSSGTSNVYTFTTADRCASFKYGRTLVTGSPLGTFPSVAPKADGTFWADGAGQPMRLYPASGGAALVTTDATNPELLATTAIKHVPLTLANSTTREYLLSFAGYPGTGPQGAALPQGVAVMRDITATPATPPTVLTTPALGSNANTNASGDVEYSYNVATGVVTIYVLGTNNGLGAFRATTAVSTEEAPAPNRTGVRVTALGGRALRVEASSDVAVSVFDVLGRSVLSQRVGVGTTELSLSSLAPGRYFARVGGTTTVVTVQ